jgi:predicted signal transduction protein with EAL and GGDEF domain
MNDEIRFANKIRQALNEGARLDKPRDARVAERLRAAREQALAARRPGREPAFAAARASTAGLVAGFGGIGGFSLRVVLPVLLTIAGLVAIFSWQQDRRAADIEELDAQLLTDDLPIDAYLDKGFEAWLKKVSSDAQ